MDLTTNSDVGAFLEQMLETNRQRNEEARAAAPKLPRLSYRQRRAEWASIGMTGEEAAIAMDRALTVKPKKRAREGQL